MIDENRLIEELRKSNYHHASNSREEVLLDRTIRIVQEQPKVNEWIPIEERLPELAGYRCLATIENKYGQRKVADVFTNYGMYGVSPFWLSNAKEIDLSGWKVIAWQPLPNPYIKEKKTMAENKMKEVAKLLGVEFGKPFKIKGLKQNPHRITEEGLIDCENFECTRKLSLLLKGELEIEQPILDKSEKRYLENVLRPFKDRVAYVDKEDYGTKKEFIHIEIINDIELDFPNFEKGTMYKGMDSNKHYTLEKLGLFEKE